VKKLLWAVGCDIVQKPLIFKRWRVGNFLKLPTSTVGKSRVEAAFSFVLE